MSQQQTQLTQYTFNTYLYNPAYAGYVDAVSIVGTFRNQYLGLRLAPDGTLPDANTDGTNPTDITSGLFDKNDINKGEPISPILYTISATMPINALKGGIGVSIINDRIGAFNNVNLNIGYAYHKTFSNGGKLAVGAQVKLDNIVIDKGKLQFPNEGDPLIGRMDKNDFLVDANFGVYYSQPNSLFAGLSVLNVIGAKGRSTMFTEQRSFNLHGGYQLQLPSYPTIKIVPSFWLKTDMKTFQVDLSALATFKDKFWGGLNYRFDEGLGLIFGLSWKDFFASFSYDIPMSRIVRAPSFGNVEVLAGYSFKFDRNKNRKTQKNTRYL